MTATVWGGRGLTAQPVLRTLALTENDDIQLYALKILKPIIRYLGRKWKMGASLQ